MSPERLAEKLAQAKASGRLPKVIIPVHLSGQSCDMSAIHALSEQYGFRIIEDASHAIGGQYRGEAIGNCRFSDITVFSFHPVKIITTAEGGMAMTNNARLARRMQMLRSHGITREEAEMTRPSDGPWYYQQIDLGFNYRMTDIQAALGKSQMLRLGEFVAKRHQLANRYNEMLADLPVVTPWQHEEGLSSFHLYVIQVKLIELEKSRRQVFNSLRTAGIGVNLHYIPIYLQPYYEKQGFKPEDFPESERYYQTSISLPLFPSLSDVHQDEVVDALKKALASNNN